MCITGADVEEEGGNMGGIWRQPPASRLTKTITFEGGHNTGAPPVSIGDNQSSDESGWDLDASFPNLKTRRGRTSYGSSGSNTPRLLTSFQNSTLIRAVGGNIQRWNGSDWSNIGTGLNNADWTATNFEVNGTNAIIFTNGTDPVKYWNGTTFGDLNSNAPRGKFITNDTIRVWIAKDDELHYSAFLNAQDWTTAKNSGTVQYYTNRGGNITALTRYAERIVVFKEDSMAELHGTNYFEFRLMNISDDIGCVNHKTLQEVQGLLLWLGPGLDVYTYTGARPKTVGAPIRKYLDAVNRAHLDKCFAGSDGLRYFLGLVTGSATEPNVLLCFDPKLGIWRVFSKNQPYRLSYLFKGDWFMMDSSGMVYRMGGTTDGGTAIQSEYITKPFDEGMPQAEKEYYEAHIQGYIPPGSTLSLYISRTERGNDFELIDTVTGESDSQSADIFIPMDSVPLCKWARFKLVAVGPVELYQMQVSFDIHPVQL